MTYDLLTNTQYSTIAIYVVGLDTVAVVDAAQVKTVSTEYRDDTCWRVDRGVADTQLRIRP